ncbi:MAG: DUF4381 domain-containing protein [Pseudomonadales bacterium]|nr:DUF4381 domain-containing protein [Pseudomonadales bacterium]
MNPNDPLSQLADIHLPPTVSQWPPAYGWWLLACALLIAFTLAIRWFQIHRRKKQYKMEAISTLNNIQQQFQSDDNNLTALEAINSLLKQTCMTHYGRHETAGLSGDAWLSFLDSTGNTKDFSKGPGRSLTYTLYTPNPIAPIAELIDITKKWITKQP